MSKIIFYSWQSDLPNNTNRGFIQDCINDAIDAVQSNNIGLEVVIDRDTQGVSGTPDIVSTIFEKIERANIFVADITFINSMSEGRKSPNPNVLIELGYAAKAIGWSNIICVFNTGYGKVVDLPFDLRFRRPLQYQVTNPDNKTNGRKLLVKSLTDAINAIIDGESSKEEIRNYIKQQIDTEVLTLCNHVFKIFYGYDRKYILPEIYSLLSLSHLDVQKELYERKYLGFTVLKNWEGNKLKIETIMNQPFFVQNAEKPLVNALVKVVRSLETMAVINRSQTLFTITDKKELNFDAISGLKMNPDNAKDGYVLLRKIPSVTQGVVIDFGSFKQYNVGG